ncbi:MAG: methyltransferase domain-containing protein [Verrucomicrobia bacterium]|nr:methyltransferase domain-containing protein [Verrucomicrobiota bacterium]
MSLTQWVTSPDSKHSPSSAFRRKRIALLLHLIEKIHRRYGFVTILDVGGRRNYWNCVNLDFLTRHQVTITIANLPGDLEIRSREEEIFRYVEGDGCDLSMFADDSFQIAHSNSVLEHVGGWENMTRFAREIRRLAPNFYVQTPNFWFPIEPHVMKPFFHFLPRTAQAHLVRRFNLGHFIQAISFGDAMRKVEGINLIDRKLFQELFPDATILTEKLCLMTKSLVAFRASEAGE